MSETLFARACATAAVALLVVLAARPAAAQASASDPQDQRPPAVRADSDASPAQHDMQHMHMENDPGMAMPSAREGSGTSWLPDETPMYAIHRQAGGWMLMAHGNAFLQYLRDNGDRGGDQAGSINWF